MQTLSTIFFYIISAILIINILGVIFSKKISTTIICSLFVSIGFGGLLFLLQDTFNATVQLLIGCVGISLLTIFLAILTTQENDKMTIISKKPKSYISAIVLFLLWVAISIALIDNYFEHILDFLSTQNIIEKISNTTTNISESLLNEFSITFIIMGIILLILLVGFNLIEIFQNKEEKK